MVFALAARAAELAISIAGMYIVPYGAKNIHPRDPPIAEIGECRASFYLFFIFGLIPVQLSANAGNRPPNFSGKDEQNSGHDNKDGRECLKKDSTSVRVNVHDSSQRLDCKGIISISVPCTKGLYGRIIKRRWENYMHGLCSPLIPAGWRFPTSSRSHPAAQAQTESRATLDRQCLHTSLSIRRSNSIQR